MDLNLCRSWVRASEDPIKANYQKKDSFWTTVAAGFAENAKGGAERSISSLQSRWADINKKCTKFNGIISQTRLQFTSGFNEEKYAEVASKLYKKEMNNEDFPFLACWEYLKEKPKWTVASGSAANFLKEGKEPATKAIKRENSSKMKSVSNTLKIEQVDDEIAEEEGTSTRPLGSKEAARRRAEAQRLAEADDKAARAMEARAESHKMAVQFKIMTAANSDAAKEWLRMMSENILEEAKREAEAKKRAADEQLKRAIKKKELLVAAVTPTAIATDLTSVWKWRTRKMWPLR